MFLLKYSTKCIVSNVSPSIWLSKSFGLSGIVKTKKLIEPLVNTVWLKTCDKVCTLKSKDYRNDVITDHHQSHTQ